MERRVHREPPPLISITSSPSSSRLQISFPGICSSKRNRDRSCTTKVIDVASWPRINLSCCGAETVPTSPSVKAKRSTKTEAFSMEICQGIAAVFVCDQPAGEAILVDQMVADRSKPGGYGQGTYRTTFLPEGLKVYPNPHIRLFSESSGVVILEPEKSIRCFSGETDEYMIFGWIGATGLYFGFLFGLRSGVPSRPRPGMAIRGFGFLRFLFKGSTQMFSSRCVMSQFVSCLRSVISSFGHDSEIIQEWICDVSASTLFQAIVPRVFVTGDYVFVNSWGSLLDWECGNLCCIDIGVTLGFVEMMTMFVKVCYERKKQDLGGDPGD
ncbi:hypothetical protein IGI04_008589 [Brassica rapa subsp. trilocularis]|uniref:Uncharacterized protein n=1 Tax=Brassica rapa subsp. trilocularis TaxID=1813537 RepID=A0ABQ7NQB1_BRACM|nr:hypothetical protein IGI04_008589 [Brassica rapa subsp. trilocularis]